MEPLQGLHDDMAAARALKDWFVSQGISPGRAICISGTFAAMMIKSNKECSEVENLAYYHNLVTSWVNCLSDGSHG